MKIDNRKNVRNPDDRAGKKSGKVSGNTGNMTITEAQEIEKAFNEELEIFREVARMNRIKKEK